VAAVVILQQQMWVDGSSGRWLQQRASMYTEATAVVVVFSVTAAAVIVAEVQTQIPYIFHT